MNNKCSHLFLKIQALVQLFVCLFASTLTVWLIHWWIGNYYLFALHCMTLFVSESAVYTGASLSSLASATVESTFGVSGDRKCCTVHCLLHPFLVRGQWSSEGWEAFNRHYSSANFPFSASATKTERLCQGAIIRDWIKMPFMIYDVASATTSAL